MPKRKQPFTLVELIVVIVIIVILAAFLIPVLSNAQRKAKSVATTTDLRMFGLAIRLYVDDNYGIVPSVSELENEHGAPSGFSLNGDFLPGDKFIDDPEFILVTTSSYGYSQTLFSDGHVVRKGLWTLNTQLFVKK